MTTLQFLAATGTVTGSKYLLEAGPELSANLTIRLRFDLAGLALL
jgi:hypothetical protein